MKLLALLLVVTLLAGCKIRLNFPTGAGQESVINEPNNITRGARTISDLTIPLNRSWQLRGFDPKPFLPTRPLNDFLVFTFRSSIHGEIATWNLLNGEPTVRRSFIYEINPFDKKLLIGLYNGFRFFDVEFVAGELVLTDTETKKTYHFSKLDP